MRYEEILQKAIDKCGWGMKLDCSKYMNRSEYFHIIFSHSFAKAFWGNEFINTDYSDLENWQYHLQQMILCEEPLKYLEKFLPVEAS